MNSVSFRRLRSDHASLRESALPPYYLFQSSNNFMPDDLTQLNILITGPPGTPYAEGVWKLHLKMPHDYPQSPPKASFRTKIWHPNVEESTGSVCVDTLKRDWNSTLTLRDILITISCLLIQPNPDSALNASAGHILQEDYHAFCRQAQLMTSIHASIPASIRGVVMDAKSRGEESTTRRQAPKNSRPLMRKRPHLAVETPATEDSDDENDPASESKENDASLSPSPVTLPPKPTVPRQVLGKRPLSELPTPLATDDDSDIENEPITCSERNVAANNADASTTTSDLPSATPNLTASLSFLGITIPSPDPSTTNERRPSLPKLVERSHSFNFATWARDDESSSFTSGGDGRGDIYEDEHEQRRKRVRLDEGKENITEAKDGGARAALLPITGQTGLGGVGLGLATAAEKIPAPTPAAKAPAPTPRAAAGAKKARVGLRRL